MKKQSEIVFNVPLASYLAITAKIAISVHSEVSTNDKVLSYMLKYSRGGAYHTGNNSRQLCLERLKISIKQYHLAIKALVKIGVIIRRDSSFDRKSTRVFYEFNPFLKNILDNYLELIK